MRDYGTTASGLVRELIHSVPDWLEDPAQSDADRLAFMDYSRERTRLNFVALGWLLMAGALIWWPVDRLVYADRPQVIEGLSAFRIQILLLNMTMMVAVPWWKRSLDHAHDLSTLAMIANVLVAIWHMADIGEGDPLFLSLSYIVPLFGMMLLVPLPSRMGRMGLVAAATLGGWGVHPEASYATPGAAAAGSFLLFCCVVSVVVGHGMFILIRRSFHLHLQVDRQRDALADLTAHLEQRVSEQTRDLKSMHQRAQTVRAAQRGELARDLHDGLGQELTSMRLLVAFGKHGGELAELMDELDTQVGRVQQALRGVLVALRPERLDELGLVEATRVLALELERRSGLDIEVSVSQDFPLLPTPVSIALYRVCQEALNNALRHARAARIRVELSGSARSVELTIADDGVGMSSEAFGSGMGTRGIVDRVRGLGGTARWSGPPGTTLQIFLPLGEQP